jgi:hypothetical protein
VGDLETLETVRALGFATDDVEDLVNKLGTLGIVALGPVVAGTRLAGYKIVGTKELTKGAGTDSVYGTRLQIDEDSTRDILVARGLRWCKLSTCASDMRVWVPRRFIPH